MRQSPLSSVLGYVSIPLRRWIYRLLAVSVAALAVLPFANASDTKHDVLMETVHQFLYQETQALGDEVVINLRPPSPHLSVCTNPDPFLTNQNETPLGRVSVGVRCGTDSQQVRYLQAEVDVIGSYMVAAVDIERGRQITPDMLGEKTGNLSDLSSRAITQADDIVGKVARQPIARGMTIQSHFIQAPLLVERGQRVKVIAEGDSFRVSREGEALNNGAMGEEVRVRFGSREVMSARVVERGTLMVDF
ncbi:flagella basal body P-ring formation protein FlgA [Vreelandella subterranea]|uniref:Flagella basal body P-ring formation protein FlgA n=1 Tax=Vreelandella subterranea TaxID=416874 RepID=A0A1H9TWZ4_9GAMM|nr:flagellar basal body P-ring formation chaperone FlgA [Halomonas subterranea]SES01494.1 flagella basal body P-ring formation protein FlgA [Halomonas subterranea]